VYRHEEWRPYLRKDIDLLEKVQKSIDEAYHTVKNLKG